MTKFYVILPEDAASDMISMFDKKHYTPENIDLRYISVIMSNELMADRLCVVKLESSSAAPELEGLMCAFVILGEDENSKFPVLISRDEGNDWAMEFV